MRGLLHRWPAALALVASLLGLTFAGLSSLDYTRHLDRQIHDVHCSYIPGASPEQSAENACRVAMYSPFAALFRDRYWGGVPISLFAVGAFAFFLAFALYLLLGGQHIPRRGAQFFAFFGLTPGFVSILMAVISALRLGHFCKTCVGIYASSALLATSALIFLVIDRRARMESLRRPAPTIGPAERTLVDSMPYGATGSPEAQRAAEGSFLLIPAWALGLALFAVTPALLYVTALPNYTAYITGCGKLEKAPEPGNVLLHIAPPGAVQPATLFVDPLCPTCKAFHQRMTAEGYMDQLDLTLVLFPLDSECNWMLDRPVHPGSCAVSKAILCSDYKAMQVLEWSYEHQDEILDAAKAGAGNVNVRAMIRTRWPGLDTCIDSKETKLRLDKMLRYIVTNHLPVSTPQLFLGDTRLCDEDTDMGLSYTIKRLAPALRTP
ncbi:MAG: vitamin K epoxide reductase family protein [Byssovorax sp.]